MKLQGLFLGEGLRRLLFRDKRLSKLLVSGVERMRLKLDYVLEQYLTKPLKKLHPEVLQVMETGARDRKSVV